MARKFLTTIILVLAVFRISSSAAYAQTPNFIFYLADDQDYLDYGCYGNPNVNTPSVDKLASEGMKFTQFYTAQAICAPSRSQLYTGKYPLRTGVFVNHQKSYTGLKSITHYLKNAGYEVILAGKSHVGPDAVYDWTAHFVDEPLEGIYPHDGVPLTAIKNYLDTVSSPYCMFITSHYPHGPHPEAVNYTNEDVVVHPYMNNNENRAGYYESINMDEQMINEIVTKIDSDAKFENTVFAYASDHGRAGKFTVTEPGLRLPFVIRWPGHIQAGSTSDALVHITDIVPTFLDIAGADIPTDIDGKSFLPILKGEESSHHEYIYGVAHKQNTQGTYIFPSRMIRGKQYKYIINTNAKDVYQNNLGGDAATNAFIERGANWKSYKPYEELYDLQADPWEKNNLAEDSNFASIKQDLASRLNTWLITQDDFIVDYPAPVLWSSLHPLDKKSAYNNIPENLIGSLNNSDIYLHKHNDVPLAPRDLDTSNLTSTSVDLTWTPSIYSADVAYYQVFQNGELVQTEQSSSAHITNLTEGEPYVFEVAAVNEDNKTSRLSNKAFVNCENTIEEMIENGNFEEGIDPFWTHQAKNGGVANYTEVTSDLISTSNKALKAEIVTLTEKGYEVSSIASKINVEKDKDYVVSFYGKKDFAGDAKVKLVFQAPGNFQGVDFTLTDEWLAYTNTFTALEDAADMQVRIWYMTEGATYYIDNVSSILDIPSNVSKKTSTNGMLRVFPNSSSNLYRIVSPVDINIIEIFDIQGRKYVPKCNFNGKSGYFTSNGLPKGLIIVRVNGAITCKFINM